jgi:hypothetical protein
MKVLTTGRDLSGGGSWADLFDGLSPEQVSQLRELYGRHARWRPGRIRPQIRAARRDLIRTPGGKRFPMSLIFATQLTAVATAVLAVFAIVTVIFAILAYCTQKREVEHLFKESDRRAVDRRRAQAAGCSPAYHPIRPA